MPRPFSTLLVAALIALTSVQNSRAAESVATQPLPSRAPVAIDLPVMGEPADTALSPAQEAQIGARIVGQFYQYEYVLEDAQITEYLQKLGWKLAAASGTNPPHLRFFMVKDRRINAFALPGGYMGFNAGLITAASSESELAGVFAHELAHVTQRHIARSANASGGVTSFATWLAVLAAIIAGSGDSDVVLGALALGQASEYQRQVNFTRANELEADRLGIRTLSAAGFDTQGMASFFQRLEQQSRLYGSGVPEFLRTHPVNTTRIAEARSRAAGLPRHEVDSSLEFKLIRARTQVLAARKPSDAVQTFGALIQAGQNTLEHQYGLALAFHSLGQNARAAETLQDALKGHPRQPSLNLLQAAIDFQLEGHQVGLSRYARILRHHPRHAPAILEYARALITADRSEDARQLLLSHEQALGTHLETYRLLSQAARDVGNKAEASYQMANFLFKRGDAGGALSQLDAGLRLADLGDQDRARLSARRAEVRQALPEDWRPERQQVRRR